MKISVHACEAHSRVIAELLAPWDVQFVCMDEADAVVVYKEKPFDGKKTLVIPSDSRAFDACAKETKSRTVRGIGNPASMQAGINSGLSITATVDNLSNLQPIQNSKDRSSSRIEMKQDLCTLTVDVVKEYTQILDRTFNAKSSLAYRLLESSPIPYRMLPKQFTNFVLKNHQPSKSLSIYDKLPLDSLRFALKEALEILLGEKLHRKTWNGKSQVFLITHDVETERGLQRACCLKKLEEKYDIPSAWYIPSRRYKLNQETIRKLANFGEVGAHDTTHDGKLGRLPEPELIKRLLEAKRCLEKASGYAVRGFRTPLLQHNVKLLEALERAGYSYDTSVPTWEPVHPRTMKPHGIGTVFPLKFEGLLEIPLTLPQDHQLLHASGLTPRQIVKTWLEMMNVVRSIEGICSVLIHPDYEFADRENLNIYEELLTQITSNDRNWITTPSQILDI